MQSVIVIDYRDFEKTPIKEFERPLKEKFIALKVITGYNFDDGKLILSNLYGDWFSISIYRTGAVNGSIRHKELQKKFGDNVKLNYVYDISMWDYKGTTGLYNSEFVVESYDSFIPKDTIKQMIKLMEDYTKGIIPCSDCGNEIKLTEVSGSYFAGRYCKDCWLGNKGKHKDVGGWQKVESQETYN